MIVDPAGTIYRLKKTLMENVGFFEREFLFKAGFAGAQESLSSVVPKALPDDPREALQTMLDGFNSRGYGTFVIKEIDQEKMIVKLSSSDTAEGWSFQTRGDFQKEPVCSYARGMLSFASGVAFLGDPQGDHGFTACEIECIGAGAKECVFVVGPEREIVRLYPDTEETRASLSEHELRLNEEILLKNLELQSLNLELERQVRKRTEDFWRSEENYASLMRQSPDPVALITLTGKLIQLNAAGMKMLGFGPEEDLLNTSISNIFSNREHAWERVVWTIEKEGRANGLEMVLVDRTGRELTGQVFARFAELAPGKCVEAVFKDVTEQKRMEEQVREARLESDFLNDLLAHDIINYTVSALHFLGALRKTATLDDDARKKLEVVTKEVQGAVDLAVSVRDLSRVKSAELEPEEGVRNLQQLLAEAIEDSKTLYFDRNTKFNFQRSTEPRYAKAGPLVSRLFANLITNSIKYDQHDVVTIDVTISDFTQDARQYWRTEISDRGIGIPDSEKETVFTRFKRGNTKVSGSGMGLFVAASIAEVNGGKIWAEDRIHGDSPMGTKMVVLLPKATSREIAELRTRRSPS